jgi:hypothetical protein
LKATHGENIFYDELLRQALVGILRHTPCFVDMIAEMDVMSEPASTQGLGITMQEEFVCTPKKLSWRTYIMMTYDDGDGAGNSSNLGGDIVQDNNGSGCHT